MRRLLPALVFAGMVVALLTAPFAFSHTSTCSHIGAGYYVTIPNGKIYYEDFWISGHGSGPHYHDYRTRKKTYTNGVGWSAFSAVHYHYGRVCPGHPV
jgi:hypothetical protein